MLTKKSEIKKDYGWHNVITNPKFRPEAKDPNCIIEMPNGKFYACNKYENGYEIRYDIENDYEIEGLDFKNLRKGNKDEISRNSNTC